MGIGLLTQYLSWIYQIKALVKYFLQPKQDTRENSH